MALMTVVVMSVILFLLATTILMLTSYRTTQTTRYTARNQAMHLADAGLNEYLYQLSVKGTFYKDRPTLGPVQLDDGTWTVQASQIDQRHILVQSTGTLANGTSRTITAKVRYPAFSDYAWCLGSNISFGPGAVVDGQVWVVGNIYNQGTINLTAKATGTCYDTSTSGSNSSATQLHYPGGWVNNADAPDFGQLSSDLLAIKTEAIAQNTNYLASGKMGYLVTFNGAQAQIERVTAVNKQYSTATTRPVLGAMTTDSTSTVNIPLDPEKSVMYFDDYVWVAGHYSKPVTLVSSKDIYFTKNLLCDSTWNSTDKMYTDPDMLMGLIAGGKLVWPIWYKTMPNDLRVDAAMIAQTGTIGMEMTTSFTSGGFTAVDAKGVAITPTSATIYAEQKKNNLTLCGSLTAAGGPSGFVDAASPQRYGFTGTRNYVYDKRFMDKSPPMFPQLRGASLRVITWLDE
jgi:hypothetical protein